MLFAVLTLLHLPAEATEFDFMHLWRTESERQALAVLQMAVTREGLIWREHAVDGNFSGVRTKLSERVALGDPPSATFWIGGSALGKFVDEGLFRAIQDSPGRPRLRDILLPEVRDMVAHGDGYAALPLGIHLQNVVVYNRAIFNRLSLKIPQSWQDFLSVAPAISKAGYTPLSMSDQRWQLRFLFTSILAEQLDHEELQGLLENAHKNEARLKPKLHRALEIFEQLRSFVNADYHDLAWEKVALAVGTDKAAAVVMGDFLAPLFSDNTRFECGLAPGNKFVLWSMDVAVFPRLDNESRTVAQDIAIRAWANASVLERYIQKKGGVSVLNQPNIGGMSACMQQSNIAWRSGAPRIPLVTELWSNQLNRLSSVAAEFWGGAKKSTEEVADLILTALKSH